ncbi:MAG: hypothetical protein C0617_12745 [Desulfuromonas sp.]|uniref:type IV pilus biogenesis protein PilM n=1 Tax=Desulfuromonas sp. TaxID=892 RepID=UPI000CB5B9B8|nr:hypothetical protein [Desulfuromonas sp.]PLX83099.1 MAG: hypothetical protein C0617_12745 [Desulfuromonas sp.]
MIYRNYLGLDMSSSELRAVALRRRGRGSALSGGRVLSLNGGLLVPSLRQANVADPERMVAEIREVLAPLAGREDRVALSLPDQVGRVLLTEVETAFKSKAEGVDILKWKMKEALPLDPKDIVLDYQILEKTESGRFHLAVAFVARSVLNQYEDILAEAGYNAAVVDFHSLNLYNYYRPRLDLGEDFVLVGVDDRSLSLQYFHGQVLAFRRVREMETTPSRLFQELKRSLVGCQETHRAFGRAAVFLHCERKDSDAVLEAVGAAFEGDVRVLDPHLERLAPVPLDLPAQQVRALVAAVGAAERMM